ncbi:hypothetical protein HGRIS_003213 [Hohenbuehelia grisea]|uniref:Ras-domain-containing protein n=1 Tax=Hohenbuehelia grisea TaxID=104357 RepID=A0ABR3JNT0_9AGAR
MLTIKLVVIGASGVGKTSLRGQYISGRFSSGYRATIGADFISKTLPHPSHPDESIALQIWDTAGQERFSSLSTAFFRGADACILMYDVNDRETLEALTKWWMEFCDRAPLAEEEVPGFCCAVVGNKTDLVEGRPSVTEAEAARFLDELIPPSSRPATPSERHPSHAIEVLSDIESGDSDEDLASSQLTERPGPHPPPFFPLANGQVSSTTVPAPSASIAIINGSGGGDSHSLSPKHSLSKSRSRSSSRFYGTMSTTHTTATSIYHTPSSSLFDIYHSARASPEPSTSSSSIVSASPPRRARRLTVMSNASTSSSSAATITPSLFARQRAGSTTSVAHPDELLNENAAANGRPPPPPPPRGSRLFTTSAKTGDGVRDVFEYIVSRVVHTWEYEEALEARKLHMREASAADTIRLGNGRWNSAKNRATGLNECCGS